MGFRGDLQTRIDCTVLLQQLQYVTEAPSTSRKRTLVLIVELKSSLRYWGKYPYSYCTNMTPRLMVHMPRPVQAATLRHAPGRTVPCQNRVKQASNERRLRGSVLKGGIMEAR